MKLVWLLCSVCQYLQNKFTYTEMLSWEFRAQMDAVLIVSACEPTWSWQ